MVKKNVLIIGAVVLLAALLVLMPVLRPAVEADVVIITVDGQEYARIPLDAPQIVTIEQENGAVNVVEITESGAVMRSSTCANQQCIHMGAVTRDNWEHRAQGSFIICLPNKVSVELAVIP